MSHQQAFAANRALWNVRVPYCVASAMYDVDGFVAGRSSLTAIEKELLGEVNGLDVLHLQCHFGQDTLSLARMGAHVTGLDISDAALAEARALAVCCGLQATWVSSNVLHHRPELDGRFDMVYTNYGTIGRLPEIGPWARNIGSYLRPGGRLVFVEFHPVLWMFDNDFTRVEWSYFNKRTIVEEEQSSYADRSAPIQLPSYGWNHDLAEVITALLDAGLRLERFVELDGTEHQAFPNMVQGSDGLYRLKSMESKLPLVFGLAACKA